MAATGLRGAAPSGAVPCAAATPLPGTAPELRAYLDNAATTPVLPAAAAAMAAALGVAAPGRATGLFANPSAVHRWGLHAAEALEEARRAVAAALGAAAPEVVFTSGGTEANHLAILGLCRAAARRGRHVVTTAIEHRSVLTACALLEAEGWAVTRLPVGPDGRVRPADVAAALRPETALVALAHVNNEIGALQPVEAIAAALRRSAAPVALHIDAVQALGKVPTPYGAWGVTTAAVSGHKVGGPKGVGALYVASGARLRPPVPGGEQEGGLRPGTENVPGIVGFGAALRAGGRDAAALRAGKLRLWDGLRAALRGLEVNGPDPADPSAVAPHILNLSFAAVTALPAEVLLHALEAEGVACSAGSACSARRPEPSHVLAALGLRGARLRGSLRLSLGPATEDAELDWALRAIPAALAALPRGGGRP